MPKHNKIFILAPLFLVSVIDTMGLGSIFYPHSLIHDALAILNAVFIMMAPVESNKPKITAPINILRGLIVFTDPFTNNKVRWLSVALFIIKFMPFTLT